MKTIKDKTLANVVLGRMLVEVGQEEEEGADQNTTSQASWEGR